jgi:hypothetical protein
MGKIYYGEPAEIDTEISEDMGFKTPYLELVAQGRKDLEDN